MKIEEQLTFDDVLLKPKYFDGTSRSNISTNIEVAGFKFNHPFIPANMKTVTGSEMLQLMIDTGGLGILHRFDTISSQINTISILFNKNGSSAKNHVGVSVGARQEDYENIHKFLDIGVRIFCVDIAHGHSKLAGDITKYIAKNNGFVISGNVATRHGAKFLFDSGATMVKVGIGSSGICTTRLKTGNGVPQLSAIMECAEEADNHNKYIISDGGIKIPGDACKALCFADMVMCGNVFAGTKESPGIVFTKDGSTYKSYDGSSTENKTNRIEGIKAYVPYKGSAQNILQDYVESLQSCCSYQGVNSLRELKVNPQLVRITGAGYRETNVHDVITKL